MQPLNDKLKKIDTYPFHMPGHKRNEKFNITASNIDITEIDGFDNLHNPKEILLDLENRVKKIYNSKKSFIGVNGSTGCILASIFAVCNKGDKIIISRNCHKSVYNACYINELKVIYIEPAYDTEFNCYKNVTQQQLDLTIKNNPDAKAVVITSPTYEGVISEIHCDIPLIVDAAHGAHFGLADYLPSYPCADIVISSFHKTLPALTQTAVINVYNDRYIDDIRNYVNIFETSSPSYVLIASIERCVDIIENSNDIFKNYKANLDDFYYSLKKLKNIKVLDNDDITRIVFSVDGYTGIEISNHLRKYNIEVEGATLDYIILISTIGDTQKGFNSLINALKELDIKKSNKIQFPKISIPKKYCEAYEINKFEKCEIINSLGKISASTIYAYPPGVPIITKGEIIDEDFINFYINANSNGVNIINDSYLPPNIILTKLD